MSSEPKKVDRRNFIYAGLGAVALVAIGAAAYIAMNPPVVTVTQSTTVPTTSLVTTTSVVTTTVPTTTSPTEKKLTVWARSAFVAANNDWIKKMCLEWAQKKGFKIDISLIPVAELTPKLIAAIEAGTPPDVCIHGFNAISFAEQGLLVPLDDVVNELGKDDIHPFKLKQATVNGKVYCLPDHFELLYNIIRKDLADAKGVKLPPQNLDELYQAAKTLTEKDKSIWGFGYPLGKCYDTEGIFNWVWFNLGGKVMTSKSSKGVVIKDDKAFLDAIAYTKKFWDEGLTPPDSDGWTDASNNQNYIDGRIAITQNPPSIYYSLMTGKPELAAKTVIAPAPPSTIDGGEESCYVFNKSKYVDDAKDLIVYLFKDKEEYRKGMCENGNYYSLPIFKSTLETVSQQWQKGQAGLKAWLIDPKEVVNTVKWDAFRVLPEMDDCVGVWEDINYGYELATYIQRAVIGKEDPVKVREELHNRVVELAQKRYG
ncbi:MAG: extracellular solute-binding protein [Nitrososphaeria archaeon]